MNTSKYVEIMNDIIKDINDGKYKAGDRLPTEAELMRTYDVSRIVVSNALSRLSDRGVITRSQGKGSFVADNNRKSEHTRLIAVVMPDIKSSYTMKLSLFMVSKALERGYKCAFFFTGNRIKEEDELLHMIASAENGERMYDGVLLMSCGSTAYNNELSRAIRKEYPIVLFDRNIPGVPLTSVHTDNVLATGLATKELIRLGHERIALCILSLGKITSLSERIEGFLLEMSKNNSLIDPSMIINELYTESQKKKLHDILADKRASAVICLNSQTGFAVMEMINEWGLRCPEDVSVIVIDKLSSVDKVVAAQPTCIVQDAEAIADKSVNALIDLIEKRTDFVTEQILVTPSLVQGFSTKERC